MNKGFLLRFFALLFATAACGDDLGRVSTGEADDRYLPGEQDGSASDANIPEGGPAQQTDASANAALDAAALDAGASLALPDGSVVLDGGEAVLLPDGAVIDIETAVETYADIQPDGCQIADEDRFEVPVEISDEGGYALVAGRTGFGLAYQALTDGNCSRAVDVAHLPATGSFPEPQSLDDECHIVRDVALVATDGGWSAAWVDNASGSAELYSISLDERMRAAADTRKRITDNTLEFELRPALARIGERTLLVWISRNTESGDHSILGRFLDGDDETFTILPASAGQTPQALAVSPIGIDVGAVAWVGSLDNPGVWLQPLGSDALPLGDAVKLTDEVSSSSSVSLGRRMDGGGIAYSAVIDGYPQVRFWRLDETASPRAAERVVIGPPNNAHDAAIASLGGGYAMTYRTLPRDAQAVPEVRLMFITREGNVYRDLAGRSISFPVSAATLGNGRTDVVVSVEGQIMIAWIDADPDSPHNLLKVARRRLDCE